MTKNRALVCNCMNQSQLFDAFKGRISKTAIRKVDDEWRIVGKFCFVTKDDDGDVWDIWICSPSNLSAGLGRRKLKHILSGFNLPTGEGFYEATGEAWGKVRGTGIILQNLDLLGIRKKRQLSDAQRIKLAERLVGKNNRRSEVANVVRRQEVIYG